MRITILVVMWLAGTAAADKTGVLDFELTKNGNAYVVRDPAFEVTFPGKPKVSADKGKAPNGTEFTMGSAFLDGGDQVFMFGLVAVGNDSAYDWKVGLAAARDRALAAMNATLVSETATKLGNLDARHVVAKVTLQGKQFRVDTRLQWDPDHRMTVMLMTGSAAHDETAEAKAFVASYARMAGTHSPLDPPPPAEGAAVTANALDFELVRKGSSYTLRDAAVEITFPRRPMITSAPAEPSRFIVGGDAYQGDTDQLGIAFVVVPPGQKYDIKKELPPIVKTLLVNFKKLRTKETKATLAGLDGRRVTVTGKAVGRDMRGDIVFLWDAGHHMAIIAYAYTANKALTPDQKAFFASLAIHADAKPPAIPAAK